MKAGAMQKMAVVSCGWAEWAQKRGEVWGEGSPPDTPKHLRLGQWSPCPPPMLNLCS